MPVTLDLQTAATAAAVLLATCAIAWWAWNLLKSLDGGQDSETRRSGLAREPLPPDDPVGDELPGEPPSARPDEFLRDLALDPDQRRKLAALRAMGLFFYDRPSEVESDDHEDHEAVARCLNLNDTLWWGTAWSLDVEDGEIDEVHSLFLRYGDLGLLRWAVAKAGIRLADVGFPSARRGIAFVAREEALRRSNQGSKYLYTPVRLRKRQGSRNGPPPSPLKRLDPPKWTSVPKILEQQCLRVGPTVGRPGWYLDRITGESWYELEDGTAWNPRRPAAEEFRRELGLATYSERPLSEERLSHLARAAAHSHVDPEEVGRVLTQDRAYRLRRRDRTERRRTVSRWRGKIDSNGTGADRPPEKNQD